MFSIGDKIVYPMHGAGTIESIEEKEMFGDTAEYYIIKMPIGDMRLMVPTETASEIGVREVSPATIAPSVFAVLEKPKAEYIYENNWSKRYRANVEKIKSGDILEVADVVRDLSHRHMERGLSTAEKKMLVSAKEILISELSLAQGLDHTLVDKEIEEKVEFSYGLGSAEPEIVENCN
ncbi:MAG: CarD family transcriptional regulator [Clostridia bacterium]|nr:CarD family transcriptional regulator [Clostridia bacterium]